MPLSKSQIRWRGIATTLVVELLHPARASVCGCSLPGMVFGRGSRRIHEGARAIRV
jgi:hypothetical protein